jgi:hypothetical protein
LKVMIVEDEMLIAMELETEIAIAGHEVTCTAMNRKQVGDLLEADHASKGIPYVFVSGNIKKVPADFAGALGAIEKPYTMNGMKNALAYISAIIAGEDDVAAPASLVLAHDIRTTAFRKL